MEQRGPSSLKRNTKLIIAIAADPRYQYEIAIAANLWSDDLSAYKNGRRQPSAEHKSAIAQALGMEVADLFDDAQESVSS